MAMVGNDLGNAIKAAVDGVSDKTNREELFQAIGSAIVDYIKTNAQATGVDAPTGDTHALSIV